MYDVLIIRLTTSKNTMKIPKSIISHPAVEECDLPEESGVDYKYSVFLKEGWVFQRGRMEGCRSGNFNTVSDFKYAEPILKEEHIAAGGYVD